MLPMKFSDKQTALLAALSSRFAVGFLAANVILPFHAIAGGVLVGLLTGIPDAIVAKAYTPILLPESFFGAVARWVGKTWAV